MEHIQYLKLMNGTFIAHLKNNNLLIFYKKGLGENQ